MIFFNVRVHQLLVCNNENIYEIKLNHWYRVSGTVDTTVPVAPYWHRRRQLPVLPWWYQVKQLSVVLKSIIMITTYVWTSNTGTRRATRFIRRETGTLSGNLLNTFVTLNASDHNLINTRRRCYNRLRLRVGVVLLDRCALNTKTGELSHNKGIIIMINQNLKKKRL